MTELLNADLTPFPFKCSCSVCIYFQPIQMPDISLVAFLGMMQYIYTNQIDKTVTPLNLVEIIRGKIMIFMI